MAELSDDLAGLRIARAPEGRGRAGRWIGLLLLLAALGAGGYYAWRWFSADRPIEVDVVAVTQRAAGVRANVLSGNGYVTARRRATVSSKITGKVIEVNVEEGMAVTEGQVDTVCVQNNHISHFTQTGKEGSLTISFTGNITSHTNKVVKVCPGTKLTYTTSSTQGPVVCKVKDNTTRGSGILRINDHLKCTDKPAGKDKVGFKVKSGVS